MKKIVLGFVAALLCVAPALAEYTLTFEPMGSDVLAVGTGAIDFTGWSLLPGPAPTIAPSLTSTSVVVGEAASSNVYRGPIGFGGPAIVSTLTSTVTATSGTGDVVGIATNGRLLVPNGYAAGDPLDGTALYENMTLADLGLTGGSSQWSWSTSPTTTDSFTVNVVPEPGSALLMCIAMSGCVLLRRRR